MDCSPWTVKSCSLPPPHPVYFYFVHPFFSHGPCAIHFLFFHRTSGPGSHDRAPSHELYGTTRASMLLQLPARTFGYKKKSENQCGSG